MSIRNRISAIGSFLTLVTLLCLIPNTVNLHSLNKTKNNSYIATLTQNSSFVIVGPGNDPNPVVNENSNITLTILDSNKMPITNGVRFLESDSPEIATVAPNGLVTAKQQGYATITAETPMGRVSNFVAVTKISSGKGKNVPGETKVGIDGSIYISDPNTHTILRKNNVNAETTIFAGQSGNRGKADGERMQAQFAGPLGVSLDNRAKGGIYIADSLNNTIRRIDFNNRVSTILGNTTQGTMGDITPFEQSVLKTPQGVAVDPNGNLVIADTGNNAIYFADMSKKEVRLLAGNPATAGNKDGKGKEALFNLPTSISIQPSKSSFFASSNADLAILVADRGNGIIRVITFDGRVSTLGKIAKPSTEEIPLQGQSSDAFSFSNPKSVTSDNMGNIYVVDDNGVSVITSPNNRAERQRVSLAQPGSFTKATSLVIQGTSTLVLDMTAKEEEAIKVITIGKPVIDSLSAGIARIEGNQEIIIKGRNFAPETQIVLGDQLITDFKVVSAREISIRVPTQKSGGDRTLTVQTRGGMAQTRFTIVPKPLSELATNQITTIAGGIPYLGDGGLATSDVTSLSIFGVAMDGMGNIFFADDLNNRIRRIDANTGIITTIAGNGRADFSGDGELAISASLKAPSSLALDSQGNIFFTDTENNRVRRIDAITNIISTVAGNGETDFNQDNIAATKAALNGPFCISIDRAGNLFIADSGNNRIRKVNLQGIITTVAGNGDSDFSGDKDLATKAALSFPLGVFVDELGNLLIADSLNNRLRKVDATTQIISTIAGTGIDEYNGDQIPAVSASLNFPTRVSVDGEGNIFIADFINNRVRRIDAEDQTITTVAGNGDFNFDGDGKAATESALSPTEVIVDGFGNLFVTDQANNRIRYVEAQSKSIKTIAGNGKVKFDGDDALATSAVINPVALTFDNDGNLIIVDRFTNRIRKIEALTGMVTSIAGCARQIGTCPEDDGLASQVELSPSDIVVDSKGNILITEATRHRVRKLDIKTGLISTIAGNGRAGFSGDGSVATEALLNSPRGIALDKAENILIADLNNKRVRKIDQATGIISTIAGNGSDSPRGDGDLATKAAIKAPMSILLDSSENIFITDVISNIVRKIDKQTGVITTIAGKGCDPLIDMSNCLPGNGGSANLAGLNFPVDIVSDGSGDLFIVEALNNQIRKVNSSDGKINPVVGNGNLGFSGDGGLALASSLNLPLSLAVDKSGNIFIADFQNGRVRAVKNLARPGGMSSQAIISSASFAKNTLTISGSGFTISKAQVIVNDKDVSSLISSQLDNQILLQGNKKSLNIKKGANQITVIVNGVASNTFVLNKLTASID